MLLESAEAGTGAPVCLLHGLFGRRQNFGMLARHLAATHRVISLDLRNHGASPHVSGMAYADMAADVLETLTKCAALPCAMLGHSMGGKVAMAIALSAPHAVQRLIVADIAPVHYQHGNARIAAALQALALTQGLDRRQAENTLQAEIPDSTVRSFLLQNLAFGAAPAWKIGLRQIADGIHEIEGWPDDLPNRHYLGPALFITGGSSDYVAEPGLAAIRRMFPNARVERLAGAGHWLHADAPAAFASLVEGFLGEASK